jgi:DNA-binding transcriptional regulator LsrR (DeoR family)
MDQENGKRFRESELKARVAWHYYVEGLTQEKISEALGIGRMKVHRILAAAREEGVVQFRIRDSVVECVMLEQRLKQKYGLREAVVVPAPADNRNTPMVAGHAAAAYLANSLNSGDVIGLGWGRTLKFAIGQLHHRQISHTTVVSLLGGLTHAQPLNPTECAWELAEKIDAECYLLPVPVYADEPQQRDAFMSQKSVEDVVFRARRANVAVLSVGALTPDSPVANYGFIRPSEIEELQALGAVGDILCHFIDADGSIVNHEVNRRVCAFPIQGLNQIPNIILVSGGREKVRALQATMKLAKVSVLITDEEAAKGLLGS